MTTTTVAPGCSLCRCDMHVVCERPGRRRGEGAALRRVGLCRVHAPRDRRGELELELELELDRGRTLALAAPQRRAVLRRWRHGPRPGLFGTASEAHAFPPPLSARTSLAPSAPPLSARAPLIARTRPRARHRARRRITSATRRPSRRCGRAASSSRSGAAPRSTRPHSATLSRRAPSPAPRATCSRCGAERRAAAPRAEEWRGASRLLGIAGPSSGSFSARAARVPRAPGLIPPLAPISPRHP